MNNHIKIVNTTKEDFAIVNYFFEKAMELQGKSGYKVWQVIDKPRLQNDIEKKLQYKIVQNDYILCIFSIQYNDPFIWRDKDKNDAIYLHRIVVNPAFKGQHQFKKVLTWAKAFVQKNNLKFIRMDTWADNKKIIAYYKSFGFKLIENYITPNAKELPLQNRNLNVALLEMEIN